MRALAIIVMFLALSQGALASPSEPAEASGSAAKENRFRVLVLEPTVTEGDEQLARAAAGLIAVELSRIERFDVLSDADVARIVELEGQKQTLGCSTSSCLAEIAGAMGANLVVFGEITRLGEVRVMTLNLFDSQAASSLGRVSQQFRSVEELPDHIPRMVQGALERFAREHGIALTGAAPGSASAPAPAGEGTLAWLPWTLVGVGGAVALTGAVLSVVGMTSYLEYTAASEAAQKATDLGTYDAAIQKLNEAEAAYTQYGQLSVILGVVGIGVGVAAAAGGAVWALSVGGVE